MRPVEGPEQVDDSEAVRLTLAGDARGPEALLARYAMDAYNVSLRILGNPADAEEATQDAFLRAFAGLDGYRAGRPFGAWLAAIARNRSLDLLRSRRPLAPLDEAGSGWPASAPDPEAETLRKLEAERVRRALDGLGGRERALLVLRYWDDLPVGAVAASLGLGEGATRVALLRARRALAARLAEEEARDAL